MEETKKKFIKICPNCKSNEVKTNFHPRIALGTPTEYLCEKCGFTSVIFPEVELEVKEEKEQAEELQEIKEKIGEMEIDKEIKIETVEKEVKKRGRKKKAAG